VRAAQRMALALVALIGPSVSVGAAHTYIKPIRVCDFFLIEIAECAMPCFCERSVNKASAHQNDIVTVDDAIVNQRFVYNISKFKSSPEARSWVDDLLPSVAFTSKASINIVRHRLFANYIGKLSLMNNERLYIPKKSIAGSFPVLRTPTVIFTSLPSCGAASILTSVGPIQARSLLSRVTSISTNVQ
jgi:hypothetical protein